MKLYLDSAYIAKCYLNDPDAPKVRRLVQRAESLHSSAWCLAEMACVFQRRVRGKSLTPQEGAQLRRIFQDHVSQGVWVLLSLDDSILRAVDASLDTLPPQVMLRAGDAVHLVSAQAGGFSEIWSNDRRLLRAAPHFGLNCRSV